MKLNFALASISGCLLLNFLLHRSYATPSTWSTSVGSSGNRNNGDEDIAVGNNDGRRESGRNADSNRNGISSDRWRHPERNDDRNNRIDNDDDDSDNRGNGRRTGDRNRGGDEEYPSNGFGSQKDRGRWGQGNRESGRTGNTRNDEDSSDSNEDERQDPEDRRNSNDRRDSNNRRGSNDRRDRDSQGRQDRFDRRNNDANEEYPANGFGQRNNGGRGSGNSNQVTDRDRQEDNEDTDVSVGAGTNNRGDRDSTEDETRDNRVNTENRQNDDEEIEVGVGDRQEEASETAQQIAEIDRTVSKRSVDSLVLLPPF